MTVEELREALASFPATAGVDFDLQTAEDFMQIVDVNYQYGRVVIVLKDGE